MVTVLQQSVSEARDHVEGIRLSLGLDKNDQRSDILENALVLLSKELYQNQNHFLMELIQNADDNSYEELDSNWNPLIPTLNLTYTANRLRIDCNEKGFSMEDMEAICKVGSSTKKHAKLHDGTVRHIGEKGIGFKAVFKAADVVWIASRSYSIKFDKREKLGIIAPIWENFPEPRIDGHTSLYLKLSEKCDRQELVKKIQSIDPEILLFLRKLRKIKLTVELGEFKGAWESILSNDINSNVDDRRITLTQGSTRLRYIIKRHIVDNLPTEQKRLGCSQSAIVLAFPIESDKEEPKIRPQKVYAFLPVREYGFKFILHADFLLVSSREDIDNSCKWNHALCQGLVNALVAAVADFNAGALRYSWLRYLSVDCSLDFFQPFWEQILNTLREEPILESCEGSMLKPSSLIYVPEEFLDDNSKPLTLGSHTISRYLSPEYSSEDWALMSKLGVGKLSDNGFLEDLKVAFQDNAYDLYNKSNEWHSKLAKSLSSLITKDKQHRDKVAALKVIPLNDGSWISAQNGKIFFSDDTNNFPRLPEGIPISVVDPEAEADFNRHDLFTQLNVQSCNSSEICLIILGMHRSSSFKPEELSLTQLISHAMFLFEKSWPPLDDSKFWFVVEDGRCLQGPEVYMDVDPSSSLTASDFFENAREMYPFLHGDYLAAVPEERKQDWIRYLRKSFNVSTHPRLVQPLLGSTFDLSDDFKFVLKNFPASRGLQLLRDYWGDYSKWIMREGYGNDQLDNPSKDRLRDKLAQTKVKCLNGQEYPLGETFLPSVDPFMDEYGQLTTMPILDIEDPKNEAWSLLKFLNVTVKKHVRSYLLCLEGMEQGGLNVSPAVLSYIYEQIQAMYSEDEVLITTAFKEKNLICVRDQRASTRWVKVQEFLEMNSSSPHAPQISSLEDEYPSCVRLFRNLLQKKYGELERLVTKALSVDPSSSKLTDISQLLIKLNKAVQTLSPDDHKFLEVLRHRKVFPISMSPEAAFRCVSAFDVDSRWFIPDKPDLVKKFDGKVPMLALPPGQVNSILHLLQEMQLESRLLSKSVDHQFNPRGKPYLHSVYTEIISAKAKLIKRLIPEHPRKDEILKRLEKVQVYQVGAITKSWFLTYREFNGPQYVERSQYALFDLHGHYNIFMTEEGITAPVPPAGLVEEFCTICSSTDRKIHMVLEAILNNTHLTGVRKTIREWYALNGDEYYESDDDEEGIVTSVASRPSCITKDAGLINRSLVCRPLLHTLPAIKRKVFPSTVLFGERPQYWDDATRVNYVTFGCPDELRNPHLGPGNETLPLLDDDWAPETLIDGGQQLTSDILFIGELITSRFFHEQLGALYRPEVHWTSNQRKMAGYQEFQYNAKSAFAFLDNSRQAITKLLVQCGYKRAAAWTNPPNYYFDVIPTMNGLQSPFPWTLVQFNKARKFNLSNSGLRTPRSILILVRVCNIYSRASLHLLVDPWDLYISSHLDVLENQDDPDASSVVLSPIHNDGEGSDKKADDLSEFMFRLTLILTLAYALSIPHGLGFELGRGLALALELGRGLALGLALGLGFESSHKDRSVRFNFNGLLHYKSEQITTAKLYQFRQLKDSSSIRLLVLFPGKEGTGLQGAITHASLKSLPPFVQQYRALSYVWGSPKKLHSIQTPAGIIRITSSLSSALGRLRESTESIILWVDAICINQDDSKEKSQQIRLLPRIFRSAFSVVAYLGIQYDHSDLAIETLLQILFLNTNPLKEWPKTLAPIPSTWGKRCVPPAGDPSWVAIRSLFSRPWFRRAWIVQEFVAARRVQIVCGAKWNVDWNDLFAAIKVAEREANSPDAGYIPLDSAWERVMVLSKHREWEAKYTRWTLLHLLESFGYTEATLLHDRFFALLGFAYDGNDEAFEPDYEAPIKEVVLRYARKFVGQGKVMDLLHRAGLDHQEAIFPSWVPDWTTYKSGTLYDSSGLGIPCAASGYSEPLTQFNDGAPDELLIQGQFVDEIVAVSTSANLLECLDLYLKEVDIMVDSLRQYPTGELLSDLKWKAPIANAEFPEEIVSAPLDLFASYRALKRVLARRAASDLVKMRVSGFHIPDWSQMIEGDASNIDEKDCLLRSQNYINALQGVLRGWRFIVTRKNYVGVASNQPVVGDKIALFSGGVVPFVLKESKGSSGRDGAHRLVGECYIHGAMDGTLWHPFANHTIRLY